MTETRSCNYNVQAFPEDEPHACGKTGIKRATSVTGLDMVYCKKHFAIARDRLTSMGVTIKDYPDAE